MSGAVRKVWYAPNKFEAYGEEEIQAVVDCLRDGWLAGFGPRTEKFEERVSALFGKKYGLFVNSGSSANLLALTSVGLEKGDEIITPALSFATVVAPIDQLGFKPVFIDVEHARYVPTVEAVLAAVNEKTRAIFIPNLIGAKPDWQAIREGLDKTPYASKVLLIEDSCDTITYTPWTDVAVTSFYASHIITAGGSGGMVMFNKIEHKNRATMYRDWGRIGNNSEDPSIRFEYNVDGIEYDFKFLYGVKGYNFKSSEMNSAFGLVQLDKLPNNVKTRRTLVNKYLELLKDCEYVVLPKEREEFNWLAMPFMSKHRAQLLRYLEANDVQTRVCFAGNITRHPAYREHFGEFAEADRVMKEGFLLGAHHGMTVEDVERVCTLIKNFKPTA